LKIFVFLFDFWVAFASTFLSFSAKSKKRLDFFFDLIDNFIKNNSFTPKKEIML